MAEFHFFDLQPNKKVPLRGSHGFLDAVPASEFWGAAHKVGNNVGLATGQKSGVVVIDCDGEEGIKNFRRIFGDDAMNTLVQKTPKGWHFIYASDEAFRSNASVIAPKVDVRANGGYIVFAPSEVDGKRYTLSGQIAPLPDSIKAHLDPITPKASELGEDDEDEESPISITVMLPDDVMARIRRLERALGL